MWPLRILSLFAVAALAAARPCRADEPAANPDLHAARRIGLTLALTIVEKLEDGDNKDFPRIKAWLGDFRKAIKGIDPKGDAGKWPAFDADVVLTRNPHFWQLYFELAPADPGLALLHAGLLLYGGEGTRASYLLTIAAQRQGLPPPAREGFGAISRVVQKLYDRPSELLKEGTELHDAGDYEGAKKKYREALALWPQYGMAHYEWGFSQHFLELKKAGKKPPKDGVIINGEGSLGKEVTAAYEQARKHDPLLLHGYQGDDRRVIAGALALMKTGLPAWRKIADAEDKRVPNRVLIDLASALQEAGVHDLALAAKAVLAARNNRYLPEDHAFLAASLKKLAPGEVTEATLKKLAGEKMVVRPLMAPEQEKAENPKKQGDFEVKQVVQYVRPQERQREWATRSNHTLTS
jgi:tetratricopeptide (TPR) repeat protein